MDLKYFGTYFQEGMILFLIVFVANLITESQCQATNEEEVFKILNERSLYPVGWIHVCLPIFSLMLIKSRGFFLV